MSGIQVIDRRDLERLLKHLVHAEKRDDVRVEVKYYVQFSLIGDDEYSAQTLVDPWQNLSRTEARSTVKAALEKLDKEANKNGDGAAPSSLANPVITSEDGVVL